MTPRTGTAVVLTFALVWLWVGAHGLPAPFNLAVGLVGLAIIAGVAWHAFHRPASVGTPRRFDRRKFFVAVAFEVIGANLAALWLGKIHALGSIWPAVGIVVGLHFIGLWWATLDPRYLTLTVVMTVINIVAFAFPSGSAAMLAISGLGSSAALAAATVRR